MWCYTFRIKENKIYNAPTPKEEFLNLHKFAIVLASALHILTIILIMIQMNAKAIQMIPICKQTPDKFAYPLRQISFFSQLNRNHSKTVKIIPVFLQIPICE